MPPQTQRRWPWLVAAAALLLTAGGLYLRTHPSQAEALPAVGAPAPPGPAPGVSARGRIEPQDGILRIAGPASLTGEVVARLLVDEGDRVAAGQLLATLDTEPMLQARIAEAEAELRNAEHEYARSQELNLGRVSSDADRDRWEMRVTVMRAQLARARAELDRARITAPAAGVVLDVHARPRERIGPEGILELARVDRMYAIAEVYETDVGRVRKGQRARVTSRALSGPLTGQVEWVRPKVQKLDEIGTDPAARKDARIVEVKVILDDAAAAADFTNLQVEVEIEP